MASRKQKAAVPQDEAHINAPDAIPSGSQDASQDIDDAYRQKLEELDRKNVQARRRNMEESIRVARQQRFNKIHREMREFEETHETRLNGIQRPQVEELQHLVQRKLGLENRIGTLLRNVQKCQYNAAEQLDACIQERVRELRNGAQ